ncbi:hypothetical protein [Vagococcus luciliae]|nr:hypothetical protein [Vagococcus luciliae]
MPLKNSLSYGMMMLSLCLKDQSKLYPSVIYITLLSVSLLDI